MKIIKLCPVCAGKGKFLTQTCPTCHGQGGSLLPLDPAKLPDLHNIKSQLSEQEIKVFELYLSGFSQQEILKEADLTKPQLLSIFYRIQQKLDTENLKRTP